MRVVMVSEMFLPEFVGGGEVSSHLMAKTLATRHDVTVITTKFDKAPREERMDGFTVKRVIPRAPKGLPVDLRRGELLSIATMSRVLGELDGADIVHVYGIRATVGAGLASRANKVPIVATVNDSWGTCLYATHFRGGKPCPRCSMTGLIACMRENGASIVALPYIKAQLKQRLYMIRRFDGLMPVSEAMAKILRAHGVKGIVEVVPSIVDAGAYPMRQPPEKGVLGFIGRIDNTKGLDVAIRAVAALVKKGEDVTMRVAGDGPALEDNKVLARKLRVSDRVEFLGKIPLEEVPAFYASVDISVLPFTRIEALPRSILESMACGRAVVTTDICGGSEMIKNGMMGFVVPAESPDEVARVVASVVRDGVRVKEMGLACRRFIEEEHAPSAILKKVEAVYRKVLEKRKGKRGY